MNHVQTLETQPQTADKLLKINQQNIKQSLLMTAIRPKLHFP